MAIGPDFVNLPGDPLRSGVASILKMSEKGGVFAGLSKKQRSECMSEEGLLKLVNFMEAQEATLTNDEKYYLALKNFVAENYPIESKTSDTPREVKKSKKTASVGRPRVIKRSKMPKATGAVHLDKAAAAITIKRATPNAAQKLLELKSYLNKALSTEDQRLKAGEYIKGLLSSDELPSVFELDRISKLILPSTMMGTMQLFDLAVHQKLRFSPPLSNLNIKKGQGEYLVKFFAVFWRNLTQFVQTDDMLYSTRQVFGYLKTSAQWQKSELDAVLSKWSPCAGALIGFFVYPLSREMETRFLSEYCKDVINEAIEPRPAQRVDQGAYWTAVSSAAVAHKKSVNNTFDSLVGFIQDQWKTLSPPAKPVKKVKREHQDPALMREKLVRDYPDEAQRKADDEESRTANLRIRVEHFFDSTLGVKVDGAYPRSGAQKFIREMAQSKFLPAKLSSQKFIASTAKTTYLMLEERYGKQVKQLLTEIGGERSSCDKQGKQFLIDLFNVWMSRWRFGDSVIDQCAEYAYVITMRGKVLANDAYFASNASYAIKALDANWKRRHKLIFYGLLLGLLLEVEPFGKKHRCLGDFANAVFIQLFEPLESRPKNAGFYDLAVYESATRHRKDFIHDLDDCFNKCAAKSPR